MTTTPKITRYAVNWHVSHDLVSPPSTHTTNVQVSEGYTTEADIPRIIACARTGNPDDGQYIVIDRLTVLPSIADN